MNSYKPSRTHQNSPSIAKEVLEHEAKRVYNEQQRKAKA